MTLTRQQTLNNLRENPEIPVLIIGAGINGIGTFRELAAQGLRVLMVDKADFASGASAGSSHMLHGGIRYLENGEFRLVHEALTERNLLLRNAPHYAKPLPTTVPMFKWFSGLFNAPLKFVRLRDAPAERGAVVIKIGLMFYDFLARKFRVMPKHTFRLKDKSLAEFPRLNPEVKCTATYYDAWMPSPERLCLDLITDTLAMGDHALALNYVAAVDGDSDTVTLRDELTGETVEVQPQVVVNAGGPWIDFVNRAIGKETQFIGGTKGAHLILDKPELFKALNGSELFFENKDGRIVLILPYMGKVMVGTTDIRIEDPDEAWVTEDEIGYILDLIPKVFPDIPLSRADIIFQFSGVRPLPYSDKSFTGNVSRDHSIETLEPSAGPFTFPILSLVGGKWTTFRAFSEVTADDVLKRINHPRKMGTQNMPIGGGKDYPSTDTERDKWVQQVSRDTDVSAERLSELFDRYGTRAAQIAGYISQGDDAPLSDLPAYSRREIAFLIHDEKALRIDDLVLRRSLMAWLGQLTDDLLADLADIFATELGWSEEQKLDEWRRAVEILNGRYAQTLAVPAGA
jgi:glycerol-3-phosphate dehydrogenase